MAADRTPTCPTCGSDDVGVRLAGCRSQQWELDVDPWHFNLPGYPGHRKGGAADRTPNELADVLEGSQNSYIAMMADGHRSIIVRSKDDELAECYQLMAEAAVLLRRQGEQLDIQTALATNYAGKAVEYKQEKERAEAQLDTLRNAIGDPDNLRLLARTFDLPILARIAAAVPQDPETCACGKPATGTVGGVPTCGDDR